MSSELMSSPSMSKMQARIAGRLARKKTCKCLWSRFSAKGMDTYTVSSEAMMLITRWTRMFVTGSLAPRAVMTAEAQSLVGLLFVNPTCRYIVIITYYIY